MQVLVFDLKGNLGHFRRPDTTVTFATYPFITRTALRGLLGAVLGVEEFHAEAWVGISLLAPVRNRVQQLSLLGKDFLEGGGKDFNRPTAVELVVAPHYRIYYSGEHLETLTELIRSNRSHYPTYLGSAFALTVPRFHALIEGKEIEGGSEQPIACSTVVPTHIIGGLDLVEGQRLARCGGMIYEHLGNRRFRGTINFIYEDSGLPLKFRAKAERDLIPPVKLVTLASGENVCLW